MINTHSISNFQSHKETVLEFPKGITVITGSSDSGKSAIMRSFLWIIQNRPLGDSFKSWGTKDKDKVEVAVEFDNGYIIKEREGSKNTYNINDETHFEAIKSDVPEEVYNLANLADYNIQTQHNPYFLLQDSPGEVAKKLNELIGLDIIDTIFKNLNSKISFLKGENLRLDNSIANLDTQIKEMSFLDEIQAILDRLEKEVLEKERIESESRGLSSTIQIIKDLNEQILSYEIDPVLEEEITSLDTRIKDFFERKKQANVLQEIVYLIGKTNEDLQAEIEWLTIEEPFEELVLLAKSFLAAKDESIALQKILYMIELSDKSIKSYSMTLAGDLETQRKLLKKAKMCPVCYSVIDDKALQRIEENL